MTVKDLKKPELEEKFSADHDESEIADPVNTGSTKRPADKTQGDKTALKPKTKAGYISDMIKQASRMDKPSLAAAHGKFTSVFDGGASDKSGANKATITTKEDIDEIFSGTELTEDFRERASVLFETAVAARMIEETVRLEEEFEQKLEEQVENRMDEVYAAVDKYLSYIAEQWLEDNQIAVEAGIRSEVSESFIAGLRDLFESHQIAVPEEKADIVEQLTTRIEEIQEQLDEAIDGRINAQRELAETRVAALKEDAKNGLSDDQSERFDVLVETIEWSDVAEFQRKLAIVTENYFGDKKVKKPIVERDQLINEEIEDDDTNTTVVYEDPNMRSYVAALSKLTKR